MKQRLMFGMPACRGLEQPYLRRYFFKFFQRRNNVMADVRPGALNPSIVKRTIESIGVGNVIDVHRIGYDGQPDDMPVTVELLDIRSSGFTGKIINVERDIIEGSSATLVYAKRGGGVLEFNFDDGDIKEIRQSNEAEELAEGRDIDGMLEILGALEEEDRILVSYYDKKLHGAVNVEGTLVSAHAEISTFRMMIEKINHVELENHLAREFDIVEDLVIDISML